MGAFLVLNDVPQLPLGFCCDCDFENAFGQSVWRIFNI